MKNRNKIEEELERKELEFNLHQKIESDYRAMDKYLSSSRILNFFVGVAVSFGLMAFINRFFLGSITSFYPLEEPFKSILVLLQVAVVLLCGYMNMRSMGKFSSAIIEFFKSFMH